MGTKWALFFGVVMLACVGLFIIAPFVGWWMPEGVSSHAHDVDFLFNVILGITGFFFIVTEAILIYFMARYGSGEAPTPARIPKFVEPVAKLLDSQHKIELAWTLLPAGILLYIAFAQVDTWANIKYVSRQAGAFGEQAAVQVDLSARQFEWRFRYPSYERMKDWIEKKGDAKVKADADSFGRNKQYGDIDIVNELHCFVDNPVLVHLSTRDVIHSFNLPQLRVKQDALPGKVIPVWFRPIKENVNAEGEILKDRVWDIPCAELCGWGHARMVGRLYVHETKDDFLAWLKEAQIRQYGTVTAAK